MHNGWTKKKENSATDCGPQWQNLVWMLNSYFLRNVSQFISIINENNPSIQVGLDTWILILSNSWIHGQLDISILYVYRYLDTWILGYHGYLDTSILGYFNFFQYPDNGYPKQLGYPSTYPDITSLVGSLNHLKQHSKKEKNIKRQGYGSRFN